MEELAMHWLAGAVPAVAEAAVRGVWQGAVLCCVAAVCLRMLPGVSSAFRAAVWVGVFALAAGLPLLHGTSFAGGPGAGPGVLQAAAGAGFSAEAPAAGLVLPVRVAYGVALLWAGMSLYRLGQLAAGGVLLLGTWRRAVPVEGASPMRLSGGRGLELCSSDEVRSPSVIGFWAPRLLLPEDLLASLTAGELRQVVLHECEHLRRRDDWINLGQKVLLVMFPLNPALLWMDGRLGLERELACDEGVVRQAAEQTGEQLGDLRAASRAYARCLLRLAERHGAGRATALGLRVVGTGSQLVRRVHVLLGGQRAMRPRQQRWAAGMLALVFAGGAMELERVPAVVGFAEGQAGAGLRAEAGMEAGLRNGAKQKSRNEGRVVRVAARVDGGERAGEARDAAEMAGAGCARRPVRVERAGWEVSAGPATSSAYRVRRAVPRRPAAGSEPEQAMEQAQVEAGAASAGAGEALPPVEVPVGYFVRKDGRGESRRPGPRDGAQDRDGVVFSGQVEFGAYAAIPFGDGWLIVSI